MDDKIKKAIIPVVIGLVVGIAGYSVLGVFSYSNNTVIYDEFPEQFFYNPVNPDPEFRLRVHDNSPWSFPFINPFYNLHSSIEAENNAYVYFKGSGNKLRNFTDFSIDLGRIDAGDYKEVTIILHPDEGNLTLKIDVYLDFWGKRKATTRTYSIEYLGNYEYLVELIR